MYIICFNLRYVVTAPLNKIQVCFSFLRIHNCPSALLRSYSLNRTWIANEMCHRAIPRAMLWSKGHVARYMSWKWEEIPSCWALAWQFPRQPWSDPRPTKSWHTQIHHVCVRQSMRVHRHYPKHVSLPTISQTVGASAIKEMNFFCSSPPGFSAILKHKRKFAPLDVRHSNKTSLSRYRPQGHG